MVAVWLETHPAVADLESRAKTNGDALPNEGVPTQLHDRRSLSQTVKANTMCTHSFRV